MKKETERREEDLIVGYTNEGPMGLPIYDPVILNTAAIGALLIGVLLGVISFLVARGVWPIQDFGQFSASQDWVAAITGGGVGIAIGGLAGALLGLNRMLKKHKKSSKY